VRVTISQFSALNADDATKQMLRCCGSSKWAAAMVAGRPYQSLDDVQAAAEQAFAALKHADWLEAFSHHPRIGEASLARAEASGSATWAGREQSGMAAATEAQRDEFRRLNAEYENRFEHVFLIFASGKSAAEMLAEIRRRLTLPDAQAFRESTLEQAKITQLRLSRLLAGN